MPADDGDSPPRLFAVYQPRVSSSERRALPAGLFIQQANEADIDGIIQLIMQREGFSHAQASERAFRFFKAPPATHLILVARVDQTVAGYARVNYTRTPTEPGYEHVPAGWYLSGVIVAEALRRRGIALELTRRRLAWISQRAAEAFYFANSSNRASIDLHQQLGFREVMRDFRYPNCEFSNGIGILFSCPLPGSA